MTLVPGDFVKKMHDLFGQRGDEWVQALPELLDRCTERFGIKLQALFSNLSWNLVLNASLLDGTPVVLKIGVLKDELSQEADVLKAYAGSGAIHILDADDQLGALLLERVQPGTPLSVIEDDTLATEIFCQVFEVVHGNGPAAGSFKTIKDHFSAIERYREKDQKGGNLAALPSPWVDRSQDCLTYLIASTQNSTLLHGDLHHDNILRGPENQWIIIDPKGIVGDRHFDVIQYLINYDDRGGDPFTVLSRRIDQIADRLGLDARRIAMWGIAKGVLEACWTIEDGKLDWSGGIEIAERFAKYLG